MEEISFAVVNKPYEDWDFYDGTSASSQGDPPEDPTIDRTNYV